MENQVVIFKKYAGNYNEVVDALGLPSNFYAPQSESTYLKAVSLDLDRTSYLSYGCDIAEIKRRLSDISCYDAEDSSRPFSYTQANFDGGVFSISEIVRSVYFEEITRIASERRETENYYDSLRISYIDDDGNLCAFSLAYLRDDLVPDTTPISERNYPFTVAIIKNTNLAPCDREVTYFTHPQFNLSRGPEHSSDVPELAVAQEIERLVNSKALRHLLTGLIQGKSISLDHFLVLQNRIQTNQNVDDRDNKLEKLLELQLLWVRLETNPLSLPESVEKKQLLAELLSTIRAAIHNIDYFKEKSLADIQAIVDGFMQNPLVSLLPAINTNTAQLSTIYSQLKQANQTYSQSTLRLENMFQKQCNLLHSPPMDEKLGQSVLSRNRKNLITFSVSSVFTILVALIVIGFLAPLGLILTPGIMTFVSILATAIGGLVSLHTADNILRNERHIHRYEQSLTGALQELEEKHQTEMGQVEEQYMQAMLAVAPQIECQPASGTRNLSITYPQVTDFEENSEWKLSTSPNAFFLANLVQESQVTQREVNSLPNPMD